MDSWIEHSYGTASHGKPTCKNLAVRRDTRCCKRFGGGVMRDKHVPVVEPLEIEDRGGPSDRLAAFINITIAVVIDPVAAKFSG